jgi:hypothetical protein
MAIKKIRDILIPVITFGVIIGISIMIISYGKGYRFDLRDKLVKPTGLIAATSDPTGARILIDGNLKSATNNTLSITPGWYNITIAKEGFQTWEKKIRVQGEVVTRADAYLFPANPSLSAYTTNGVVKPSLSPDGGRLAFVIPETLSATSEANLIDRAGIWILDLTDRALSFNRDPQQIAKSTYIDFTNAILTWSPDSKQILASIPNLISSEPNYYLMDAGKLNDSPILLADITNLMEEWDTLTKTKEIERLSILKPNAQNALTPIMKILGFSPDESKILYEATMSATIPELITPPVIGTDQTPEVRDVKPGTIYVYDIKEDRNYPIGDVKTLGLLNPTPTPIHRNNYLTPNPIPTPDYSYLSNYNVPFPIQWLPTSRHLILVTKDKIEAMDFDATNRKTLYSGPFWDSFVVPWSNASKLLILTSLNPAASSYPNLYAVNLR